MLNHPKTSFLLLSLKMRRVAHSTGHLSIDYDSSRNYASYDEDTFTQLRMTQTIFSSCQKNFFSWYVSIQLLLVSADALSCVGVRNITCGFKRLLSNHNTFTSLDVCCASLLAKQISTVWMIDGSEGGHGLLMDSLRTSLSRVSI